jgi:hypothetical protein
VGVAHRRLVCVARAGRRRARTRAPPSAAPRRTAPAVGRRRCLGAGLARGRRRNGRGGLGPREARRAPRGLRTHRGTRSARHEHVRPRADRGASGKARRFPDADQAGPALPAGAPRSPRAQPGCLPAARQLLRARPPLVRRHAVRPRPARTAGAAHPAHRPRSLRRPMGPVDSFGVGTSYDGRAAWRTKRATSRFAFTPDGLWLGNGGVAPGQP